MSTFVFFAMMHRKGELSLPQTFTAILFTTVCIGCVSSFDNDALLPLVKIYVTKVRTFMDSYHPEIGFARCAISTFPLYDLFPDALREFDPNHYHESLDELSSRSYNESDISNIIPSLEETKSDVSSYAEPLLLSSSTQPNSSTSSPPVSNQSSTSATVTSSMPSSSVTTPLPILAAYPELPPVNNENHPSQTNSPTAYSATSNTSSSVSLESPNPSISTISTPTSPFPSYFLFQAMTTSGISSEDAIFIIELLEIFFPDLFTSSIAEVIAAWQGGDNQKIRQNGSLADAWLEGLDAVLVSIFGAHPHVKRGPLRNMLPTLQWESRIKPENRIPISRVGEEDDEENAMRDWWTSVRSRTVRLYHRLRMWVLPDAERENLGKTEAKLVGLAHCGRDYLVNFIWRWGEDEAKELRKVEEKKPQNYIFRPQSSPAQDLPPLLKFLMPS